MDAEESITMNGAQQKDDEMRWNHKKRTKDCFLMFCEVVLQHEKELLSETLNSSQESINENRAPESGQIGNESTDSDGANGEMATYTNEGAEGGDGDSFNSVTCFCGKPFAGRPMIECSGCLTWLHMSCAKVKRKNIPEFYYCDSCKLITPQKSNGLLSPTAMMMNNASSGEETLSPTSHNGTSTLSSNSIEGVFANTKPRKPKSIKKSMMVNSSDNRLGEKNASESKKSFNGKLKKASTKKMRQSPTKATKAYASASFSAAASLTELSLNHQVSLPNGVGENSLLKSPITTNNNIYETTPAMDAENDVDKFNNKRLKTL